MCIWKTEFLIWYYVCPLLSRIHYWPIGQQRYILSCHQPVQHGWRCHFHGLADGYPQQHRTLRQLRRRPCKDLFVFHAPAWQTSPYHPLLQTFPPATAKSNIPKPVLCWHLSPSSSPPPLCLMNSGTLISVQTLVLPRKVPLLLFGSLGL